MPLLKIRIDAARAIKNIEDSERPVIQPGGLIPFLARNPMASVEY